MIWKKFLRQKSAYNSLDKKLVKDTQKRLFPSWPQFKYISHFLTVAEKRLVLLSSLLVAAAAIFWASAFFFHHIIRVPRDGGEYSEALIGQPKYLNPLFSSIGETDTDIASLIYSGLFRFNKDGQLMPDLASGYTVSGDKKTYDINLKKDIRWSDGEPFTADDVTYTFEQLENPEVGSPLISTFQGVKVEKIDNFSLRFTLKDPFAPFLSSLTVGILPEHVWGEIPPTGIRLAKNNLQPIGTGAWKFSKLLKDNVGNIQSYVLAQNENYFQTKPYLKTINFKFFSDYDQAIEAVRSQNVDALSFVPRQSKNKLGSKNLISYNLELPQYTALFFNQDAAPDLKNNDLRPALAEAIDKNTLVRDALSGDGQVIDAPILKGSVGYYPNIAKIAFNPDKANAALDKTWPRLQPEEFFKLRHDELLKNYQGELDALKKNASTTQEQITEEQKKVETQITESVRKQMSADQSFYRRNKDGKILSMTITTVSSPEYTKTAELLGKMWGKIGVQTNIKTVDVHQIVRETLKNRSYDILLYGEIVGSDPDPFPFWHSSQADYPGLNVAMFTDRNADKLLEEARITIDDNKRADLYQKFQDILAKDLPVIFLYTPTHIFVVNKNVRGISVNHLVTPADRFATLGNWYINTKWMWKR